MICRGRSSEDEDPFREWCGKVGELRALVSSPLVALTATATRPTRLALKSKLGLKQCRVIDQSPDRPNISLMVFKVSPQNPVSYFSGTIQELKTKGIHCSRLVYCQKISDCSSLYIDFMGELGDRAYWPDGSPHVSNHRLIAMYHSATPEYNKEVVLASLQDPSGICRVVFATSALGMGVEVKGLHQTIHWGPPSCLEQYMQEIGRVGRDGRASSACLLFHGHQLRHCDKQMLEYVKSAKGCRRQMLLCPFEEISKEQYNPLHCCCDLCARVCPCLDDHDQLYSSPKGSFVPDADATVERPREVTPADKEYAVVKLSQLFECDSETVLSIPVAKEVVDKLDLLFSIDDILDQISVSSFHQASKIFEVLSLCFSDMVEV